MSWMGPGRRYYYQRRRVDGRIEYTYYGATQAARLIAELDQLDHERRQQERAEAQIAHAQFAELASTPERLTELLAEARRATAQALEAAGYHQHHRGEWRKRRGTKQNESQDQGADPPRI